MLASWFGSAFLTPAKRLGSMVVWMRPMISTARVRPTALSRKASA
jgi:hypothetical protein